MVSVKSFCARPPRGSVTWKVRLNTPVCAEVPVIAPVELFSAKPDGSADRLPGARDQAKGFCPPVAVSVEL